MFTKRVETPTGNRKRNYSKGQGIYHSKLSDFAKPLVQRQRGKEAELGKMQRDKGARFERQVASMFKDWGYEAFRTSQYEGKSGQCADVEGVPLLHIECKHCEKMHLYDWIEQADRDNKASKTPQTPVVIHKANNKPILVTMHFEDFIQLYKEWEASINGA